MGRSPRLVISALALAAVLSACGMGVVGPTVSANQGFNVASTFINAVRANDASRVCSMSTAHARRDLARLLHQSGAPGGVNVCAQKAIAPRKVRAAAMRPFLGVLGFTKGMKAGGNSQSGSTSIEWSQTDAGRYAVIVVRRRADGLFVDSIKLEASCSAC